MKLTPASYLKLAYAEARKSLDPSTQQGAVLVGYDGRLIGYGHNRFARGLTAMPAQLADRSVKYSRTTHAECAVIWDAVRSGNAHELKDATLYAPWFACEDCAKAILEAEIRLVVGHQDHPGVSQPHGPWAATVANGLRMLKDAAICYCYHEGSLGCEPILVNHELWYP